MESPPNLTFLSILSSNKATSVCLTLSHISYLNGNAYRCRFVLFAAGLPLVLVVAVCLCLYLLNWRITFILSCDTTFLSCHSVLSLCLITIGYLFDRNIDFASATDAKTRALDRNVLIIVSQHSKINAIHRKMTSQFNYAEQPIFILHSIVSFFVEPNDMRTRFVLCNIWQIRPSAS